MHYIKLKLIDIFIQKKLSLKNEKFFEIKQVKIYYYRRHF